MFFEILFTADISCFCTFFVYFCSKRKRMDTKLTKNFLYFKEHHDEILTRYPNMFVVINNEEVLFAGHTFDEAYEKAVAAGLQLGTFLIQECTEGNSAFTQFFSNQVAFA